MAESDGISGLVAALRHRGVQLWAQNGELRYQAPRGSIAPGELARLKAHKNEILQMLEQAQQRELTEPVLEPQLRSGPAPLAYSQVAHWNEQHLGERRGVRAVTATIRLQGRFRVDVFQRCWTELVRRHEALRTRIRVDGGNLLQEVVPAKDFLPTIYELRQLCDAERMSEVQRLIKKHLEETIDVTRDPLFAVWLLRVTGEDQVLIVAMDHVISDGTSRDILFREFCLLYRQFSCGLAVELPPIGVQLADFAIWQRRAEPFWYRRSAAYWTDQLLTCPPLLFPRDIEAQSESGGMGCVPFQIDGDRLKELRGWCRANQTTLTMGVMAAYAGFVLRWCEASEGIIQYEFNGRFTPVLENTVGYFAFPLYLKMRLGDQDRFVDLARRIIDAYCQAHEHQDFALLKARTPQPAFARSTLFNWTTFGPGTDAFEVETADGQLIATPISFEKEVWESEHMEDEPGMSLLEFPDRLPGVVNFPLSRFSLRKMQIFAQEFVRFVYELVDNPQYTVKSLPLRRTG